MLTRLMNDHAASSFTPLNVFAKHVDGVGSWACELCNNNIEYMLL